MSLVSSFSSLYFFLATLVALVAFAANSLLCRMALDQQLIDASSFTVIRLLSGAITMVLILLARQRLAQQLTSISKNTATTTSKPRPQWYAAAMLFGYAVLFSFAYIALDTATGALLLFASVQFSLLGHQYFQGNKLSLGQQLGFLSGIAGLIYLLLPDSQQPCWSGSLMMLTAGICWAGYTIAGKQSQDAIFDTAINFIRTTPLCLLLLCYLLWQQHWHISSQGLWLAVASGSLASAMGYSVWYLALKRLSLIQAAIGQLSVPVIAAIAGLVLLNEQLNDRLLVASSLVLAGIALVNIAGQSKQSVN